MEIAKGLAGIVVDESSNSFVDGEKGVLLYRGYNIHDLARHSNFEEVTYLLWHGRLPTRTELEAFRTELALRRGLPERLADCMAQWPRDALPMDVLRTGLSLLGTLAKQGEAPDRDAQLATAMDLTAATASLVAVWERIRNGERVVEPDPDLGHAANFLWQMRGERPDETLARIMDLALVLHADHGFNASTFSARVTTSTLSDLYSAAVAAVGTLKGPLHGGANMRVMEILKEIGTPDKAEDYVLDKLARHERIMGFGHRVYRTMDPRAEELMHVSEELGEAAGDTRWYEISRVLQDVMMEEKGLNPNVDFYSASAYYLLGIPIDLYTPIFAVSRMAGWTAHILEQLADNKLIRPRARYVGAEQRPYVPLDERERPAAVPAV